VAEDFKVQLSLKYGGKDGPMLNLRGESVAEVATLIDGAKQVPDLQPFFNLSDTARAANYMAGQFEGSTTEAEIPACPSCGGRMNDKRANKKSPKSPDFTCAQEKGDCKNGNYPTGVWLPKDSGRDS
jgi:hypothetical protein